MKITLTNGFASPGLVGESIGAGNGGSYGGVLEEEGMRMSTKCGDVQVGQKGEIVKMNLVTDESYHVLTTLFFFQFPLPYFFFYYYLFFY